MTTQEAIKQLKSLKDNCKEMFENGDGDIDPWHEDVKALEIAIKALEGKDEKDD